MKYFRPISLMAALWLTSVPVFCQLPCEANFLNSVELRGQELTLADVLDPGTCPSLLRSAAQVSLGKAPLEGCDRVLEGREVRALVDRIAFSKGIGIKIDGFGGGNVPERIVVRRSGSHLSCSDIAAKIISHREQNVQNGGVNCGALRRIRKDVSLNTMRKSWDPALQSWEFTVRCARAMDCVPFLVRVAGSDSGNPDGMLETWGAARSRPESIVNPLVHAGKKSTLLWDQDGIRVILPAICLDSGKQGDTVRVRLESGSRIMQATVTAEGTLVVDR